MASLGNFVVTGDGLVHLMSPAAGAESTLCGIANDAWISERDESLRLDPARRMVVDCPQCAAIVQVCRGVRVATAQSH